MTDGLLNQDPMLSAAAQPEMAAVQSPMAPAEKMLPQSEVDKLAGRIRAEAYEKGLNAGSNNSAAQQMAQGALSEDQVRKMIQEQTLKVQQEQAQQMMAERIVGEFAGKMEAGPGKYEDFDNVVQQLDLRTIPEIVQLANSVQNTDEVMYDLGKNPYKIAQLKILAQTSPHLARAEMNRLSQSIISNKTAQAQVSGIKEPLSQIKPSTGSVDSGTPSVKDLRGASWLRR
jgi:hypothetical protein